MGVALFCDCVGHHGFGTQLPCLALQEETPKEEDDEEKIEEVKDEEETKEKKKKKVCSCLQLMLLSDAENFAS